MGLKKKKKPIVNHPPNPDMAEGALSTITRVKGGKSLIKVFFVQILIFRMNYLLKKWIP